MKRVFAVLFVTLAAAPFAQAQNINAGTATNIAVGLGQQPLLDSYSSANAQKWFKFFTAQNRSYCVSTTTGSFFEVSQVDTVLTVYQGDGTTIIGNNDDTFFDPFGYNGSRVCYQNGTLSGTEFAKVEPFGGGGASQSFQINVVDTTLFCPWFFTGGGFEAFILIKNTSNAAFAVTTRLYNAAGTVTATATGTIPANGSLNYQLSAAPFSLASGTGSVSITHTGAPGSLFANLTSLSFGQGVSFDNPFAPRQDWRQ